MVPTHWKECPGNEFCKVQEYIASILESPFVYEEQPSIAVYSTQRDESGRASFASPQYQNILNESLPVIFDEQTSLSNIAAEDPLIIIDFSDGSKPYTLASLKHATGVEALPSSVAPGANPGKHDIVVIVNP
ncbi:MAG: hypothetical protein TR69_WS6001001548 [candidate division WS6 bacterium OLB20]|uniref:Uncharacterized protein n=1 Tax=candidate division WS6 bacterium OLB20 TaxID=1617426 RepID=A0A136LVT4_9BACT|nr:MAG: hypothetical protein TR69_WS6001001548 [candidate division WS6 bacterium OLB20]